MSVNFCLVACLVCVGHGWRVRHSAERAKGSAHKESWQLSNAMDTPANSDALPRVHRLNGKTNFVQQNLATYLLTHSPEPAAFNPCGLGVDSSRATPRPACRSHNGRIPSWVASAASAVAAATLFFGMPDTSIAATQPADRATLSAENFEKVEGFEDFAAQGGKMKADPSCFFDQCKEQTTSCFTNPACLKGITCLGNCRGEQLCATQCFARFGSERLNAWLGCTLEDKMCVTTGVKQDTTKYYLNPPPAMPSFTPADLEGKWYKVLGYNPKYDTYPCQTNEFTKGADGSLNNDILFRVPKPDGSGSWQNNFKETMANSKGPQGKASMTVEGKMFGLTFHEQWYVLGKGDNYRVISYIGDTQQGPYDGAFVFTKEKDTLEGPSGSKLRAEIDGVVSRAGLDPKQLAMIDNTCPSDATKAGASATEAAKEKLEWKDVFELTEWFRPGTIKRDTAFDPTKM